MPVEKGYSTAQRDYIIAQVFMLICSLVFVSITYAIISDCLNGSPDLCLNPVVLILTSFPIITLLRQPLPYIGLHKKNMTLIYISSGLEMFCHMICLIFLLSPSNFFRIIALVHILSGLMSWMQMRTLRDGFEENEYTVAPIVLNNNKKMWEKNNTFLVNVATNDEDELIMFERKMNA